MQFLKYHMKVLLGEFSAKIGREDIFKPCALTEHHAMKAYWGSGGIAPLFL
jgi:hypothetical protein